MCSTTGKNPATWALFKETSWLPLRYKTDLKAGLSETRHCCQHFWVASLVFCGHISCMLSGSISANGWALVAIESPFLFLPICRGKKSHPFLRRQKKNVFRSFSKIMLVSESVGGKWDGSSVRADRATPGARDALCWPRVLWISWRRRKAELSNGLFAANKRVWDWTFRQ